MSPLQNLPASICHVPEIVWQSGFQTINKSLLGPNSIILFLSGVTYPFRNLKKSYGHLPTNKEYFHGSIHSLLSNCYVTSSILSAVNKKITWSLYSGEFHAPQNKKLFSNSYLYV